MLVITEIQKDPDSGSRNKTETPIVAKVTTIDLLAENPVHMQYITAAEVDVVCTEEEL